MRRRSRIGGENEEFCLDTLSLRSLLGLGVEILIRYLDSQLEYKWDVCIGGLPWESPGFGWYLKSQDPQGVREVRKEVSLDPSWDIPGVTGKQKMISWQIRPIRRHLCVVGKPGYCGVVNDERRAFQWTENLSWMRSEKWLLYLVIWSLLVTLKRVVAV